mmetsp:Transcript_67614/g.198550  ORF Transcript_67614/g.198550 Transcript_67614/m.198550 type:complete len:109 (-) Transcript_67614:1501-1827(-)
MKGGDAPGGDAYGVMNGGDMPGPACRRCLEAGGDDCGPGDGDIGRRVPVTTKGVERWAPAEPEAPRVLRFRGGAISETASRRSSSRPGLEKCCRRSRQISQEASSRSG